MLSTPKLLGIVISTLDRGLSGIPVMTRSVRELSVLIDGSSEITSIFAPVLSLGLDATKVMELPGKVWSITSPFYVSVRKEKPSTGAVLGGPRTPPTSKLMSVFLTRSLATLPSKITLRVSFSTKPF